jgi:hypothetical protein
VWELINETKTAEKEVCQSGSSELKTLFATIRDFFPHHGDDEASGWPTAIFLVLLALAFWKTCSWLSKEVSKLQRLKKMVPAADLHHYNINQFFSYRADYYLSTQSYAKPLALGAFTLIIISIGGFLKCGLTGITLGSSFWDSWIYVVDTSAHADEETTTERVSALLSTVGGMFIFATMIGLINDAFAQQLESLQYGSSPVLECGHVVILGWSDKLMPLLKELALAAESEGGGVIAVLADQDKQDMEAEIDQANLDLRGSIIVCRKGSPTQASSLDHVSVKTAKAIICLSPTDAGLTADEVDGYVMQVILCLKGMDPKGHVVSELQDVDNVPLTQLVGGDIVECVVAHDFIGRLIVQSGRQPGLAQVLESLLGFGGSEFYMQQWPELVGCRFGDVLFQFAHAIPIGVIKEDGTTLLSPENEYEVEDTDELIVLAEDDDSYEPAPNPFLRLGRELSFVMTSDTSFLRRSTVESILVVGWRRDLGDIMDELNSSVPENSEVTLFSDQPNDDGLRERMLETDGRKSVSKMTNLVISHVVGNQVCRADLEMLPLEKYTTVFILHEEYKNIQEADGRILTTLFLLRDIHQKRAKTMKVDREHLTIISEVLDPRTREQMVMAGVRDYVMSNEVVSAALAMVAECRPVNKILREILSNEGVEIYIRPLEQYYRKKDLSMSFFDVMLMVRECSGHILMGYVPEPGMILLNPDDKLRRRRWKPEELLIVLSQD